MGKPMISFTSKGSFEKTEKFVTKLAKGEIFFVLAKYGQEGVAALAAATPVRSGLAASSWSFVVEKKGNWYSIIWKNFDIENGFPVAIMLQYGYSTGTGGYVQGVDYINPAIMPIFERISADVWKEVQRA